MTPSQLILRLSMGTPMDASTLMVAHQLLSSAMSSSDNSDWPVDSLTLSFHDLHGLPLQRLDKVQGTNFDIDI